MKMREHSLVEVEDRVVLKQVLSALMVLHWVLVG